MHFSCKISNAIIGYLESQGEDLAALYEAPFPPMEPLRDSSGWLSAPDMELFLENLMRLPLAARGNILVDAGHAGPSTRAWGVLDSVLRMMPRPQEIFQQPERFLSYFIAPEPPIENLQRDETRVAFDLPLPSEQYPLVAAYLGAAFESLPVYTGQPFAQCRWNGIHLEIQWPAAQKSMFAEDPGRQVSPDLLRSVVADHQRLQTELEQKNLELQRKDAELVTALRDLETLRKGRPLLGEAPLGEFDFDDRAPGYVIGQNLSRLHDYMVRAQQLITILAGFSKKDAALKEALRRLDWDYVKAQYPRTIAESFSALRQLQAPQKTSPTSLEEKKHV